MPGAWNKFEGEKAYKAESLDSEGFIHCSFAHQLDAVLKRYYAEAESVLVLEIDTAKLASKLRIEPSTNKDMYPHVYGEINREAVAEIREVKLK